jgi:hypothetical protein
VFDLTSAVHELTVLVLMPRHFLFARVSTMRVLAFWGLFNLGIESDSL